GTIASRNGSATVAPSPRRIARRGMCFPVMNDISMFSSPDWPGPFSYRRSAKASAERSERRHAVRSAKAFALRRLETALTLIGGTRRRGHTLDALHPERRAPHHPPHEPRHRI